MFDTPSYHVFYEAHFHRYQRHQATHSDRSHSYLSTNIISQQQPHDGKHLFEPTVISVEMPLTGLYSTATIATADAVMAEKDMMTKVFVEPASAEMTSPAPTRQISNLWVENNPRTTVTGDHPGRVILGLEYLRKDDRFDRHALGTTSHLHLEEYIRPSKPGHFELKDFEEFLAYAKFNDDAESITSIETRFSTSFDATTIEIDKRALIGAFLVVYPSSAYFGPGANGTAPAPGYCCEICEEIFTDDLPETMTACCGCFVHGLCHYDSLDHNKP
ncbi:hypothetical protein N7G274_006316 [Stereocaulon virgatum]|uniref:Uncharacterized protein n=1 Tax=Stereocaulon virgatum TaxID=373712 RepID=A0ABR4A5B0_9LECA